MKKNRKWSLIICAAVVSLAVLSGCSAVDNTSGEAGGESVRAESGDTSAQQTEAVTEAAPADSTQSAPQANPLGTRTNPAKIGDTVEYTMNSFVYANCQLDIQLLEVKRGEEAMQFALSCNEFNAAPEAGKEYVLAKFRFTNKKNLSSEDKAADVNSAQFSYSDAQFAKESQYNYLALGDNDLSAELYEGASTEGYVIFAAPSGESCYGVYMDDVWFSLG